MISFIYFDVGGVAILDFSTTNKWNKMIDDLHIPEHLRQPFEDLFDEYEKKICVGMDINEFVMAATKQLGIKFPENYDMTADFVNRFEPNISLMNLAQKLMKDYKLGLLTGQYPDLLNMIFNRGLIPSTIKWDAIIDSSVEGVTKPDIKAYELAEKRAGVNPESILFVDNKAKLLVPAKERGWQTFEYDPADALNSTKKLEDYIHSL